MVADVGGQRRDVSSAHTFIQCIAHMRALRQAAPASQRNVSARYQEATDQGSRISGKVARELTPAEQLLDTRDPSDLIGANGDLMGIWEGDEQFSGKLDWRHVICEIESGDEHVFRSLLPKLSSFQLASSTGEADLLSGEGPPKALAESLLTLLESGKCSGLWQEPGALGSFFVVLHGAVRQTEISELEGQEKWLGDLGVRLMAWLYPRVDRLCLQALQMACGAVSSTLNVSWALKQRAVTEAHYLDFGFKVFEILQTVATLASFEANTLLWFAATDYVGALLQAPSMQGRPDSEANLKAALVQAGCLNRGLLEWAVKRCEIDQRLRPQHKFLMAKIFHMAASHEVGLQRFATCRGSVKALVGELDYAYEHTLQMRAAGLNPSGAPPGESAARSADVATCLKCLAFLLASLMALMDDPTSTARANARWREFCAQDGLSVLQRLLGQRGLFRVLGGELLGSDGGEVMGEAMDLAERLWSRAAAKVGLKKCSNPVSPYSANHSCFYVLYILSRDHHSSCFNSRLLRSVTGKQLLWAQCKGV